MVTVARARLRNAREIPGRYTGFTAVRVEIGSRARQPAVGGPFLRARNEQYRPAAFFAERKIRRICNLLVLRHE
jgi:hypothetical protein